MNDFDKVHYNNDYNKKNYKIVSFRVKKTNYEKLSKLAEQEGFHTPNAYAKFLLEKSLSESDRNLNQKIEIKGNVGNVGNVDTMHIINKK